MADDRMIQPEIRSRLRRLRAALRGRLAAEGAAWVCLSLVALVVVTLAFDYLLHLDRTQRAIVMSLAVVAVAWVAWRELLRPVFTPMRWNDLALLVERHNAALGDRLISMLQFARADALPAGTSEAMVRRLAAEANDRAAAADFTHLVERRELKRVCAIAACGVALIAGLAVWRTDIVRLWALRNVAFADAPWPQDTYLEVRGGPDYEVVRGDDLEIVVDARPGSVAPGHVTLHARFSSVGLAEERLDASDGGRVYRKLFQAVTEPFEFHVTGGDDRRDARRPHRVTIIDPPALRQVSFRVEYPGYMSRPAGRFEGGRGGLAVPAGSIVNVAATANKDLRSAGFRIDGAPIGELRIAAEDPPRRVAGSFTVAGPSRAQAMTLQFTLVDVDGHTNRRGVKYLLQVTPDMPPTVNASPQGVGSSVTPDARIPLFIEATDDWGIDALTAELSLSAAATAPSSEPVDLAGAAAGGAGSRRVVVDHAVDLKPRGLEPGQVLRLQIAGADTLGESLGGPNTARCAQLTFRVVTPEELMSELVRRQKELRIEFIEAVSLQNSALLATRDARAAIGEDVSADVRRRLDESRRLQTSVAAECAKAASTMSAILAEMVNNRLGDPRNRRAMREEIIVPLEELATAMGEVSAAIDAAAARTDPSAAAEQAGQVAAAQQDMVERMEAVLERMQKLQTLQELANQVRLLIQSSDELLRQLEAQQETELERVLESSGEPDRGE